MGATAFSLCRQLARQQDPDRYFAALFAPSCARPAIFVLLALNAELAGIAAKVSDPLLGDMRLTWWQEALEAAAAGQPRAQPVLQAWAVMAQNPRTRLDVAAVQALIDARRDEVGPGIEGAQSVARATSGVLAGLIGTLCRAGPLTHEEAERLADIGTAYGLGRLTLALAQEGAAALRDQAAQAARALIETERAHTTALAGDLLAAWLPATWVEGDVQAALETGGAMAVLRRQYRALCTVMRGRI